MNNSSMLRNALESAGPYVPININDYINYEQPQYLHKLMGLIREFGSSKTSSDFSVFYFCLS